MEAFPQEDWTPVFEGLHPDLRIVVDYGKRKELVLLALVHIESGAEVFGTYLEHYANKAGVRLPRHFELKWQDAHALTLRTGDYTAGNGDEGYVLTWYTAHSQGRQCPPKRLKLKYIEYLRLHRMVCGVSPKRIWECLATGSVELKEFLNDSTPWFAAFTKKWVTALTGEFERLRSEAYVRYNACRETVRPKVGQQPYANMGEERKAWALEFQRPENEHIKSILFTILDNKDVDRVNWKYVKKMTAGVNPMVDAHNT